MREHHRFTFPAFAAALWLAAPLAAQHQHDPPAPPPEEQAAPRPAEPAPAEPAPPAEEHGEHAPAAEDGRQPRHPRLLRPLPDDPRVLRHRLAAGVGAAPGAPLPARRLGPDAPRPRRPDLRRAGRSARRQRPLQRQHADADGQPSGRPRARRLPRHALGRALDDRRQGLPAAACRPARPPTAARRWSTASTRTTSSWSWPAPTPCRSTATPRSSSTSLCRGSRRSGRRPSCTASAAGRTRRRRSPTTGSTRRTSPTASPPSAGCAAAGSSRGRCSPAASRTSGARTSKGRRWTPGRCAPPGSRCPTGRSR